eukprot:8407545-Pyramimonas_sp.AAC.1
MRRRQGSGRGGPQEGERRTLDLLLSAARAAQVIGLDTAIKPLLSHSTTGEFNSPPNYLRIPHVRVEPYTPRPLLWRSRILCSRVKTLLTVSES